MSTFFHGQGTAGAAAAQLVPARSGRRSVTIINGATGVCWIGKDNALTSSNGARLAGIDGASLTIGTDGPIWVLAASGTEALSYIEEME